MARPNVKQIGRACLIGTALTLVAVIAMAAMQLIAILGGLLVLLFTLGTSF